MEPRIGRKHIRVIAIDGFPQMSSPGILRELDRLPIEYRWNTRAILHRSGGERAAMLDMHRKKWRSKIRGWKDQILRTQSGAVNIHAQEMAADAEEAMGVAAAGDVQFCQYAANIICLDEDLDRLIREHAAGDEDRAESRLLLPARGRQRRRGMARFAARRRLLECPPRPSAHAESGRHAADHLGMGRPAGEPVRPDAEEQSAPAVRGDQRRDAVPLQPACFRSRPHA